VKTLARDEFLGWARDEGIVPHPLFGDLQFAADPGLSRFWETPANLHIRVWFLGLLLESAGDWGACYAWRRGHWPQEEEDAHPKGAVEYQILKGLGVPMGTDHVLRFDRTEVSELLTLTFSNLIFDGHWDSDMYILPDNTSYLLQTDHHDVVHVSFRDQWTLEEYVKTVADGRNPFPGFPLPTCYPDETFKPVDWIDE
jgi:hypothetical protein